MERERFSPNLFLGKFSLLDSQYMETFYSMVDNAVDNKDIEICEIQDIMMKYLIEQNEKTLVNELKYRITDGESSIEVLLDIIRRRDDLSSMLWMLESKLKEHEIGGVN